MLVVDVKAIKC